MDPRTPLPQGTVLTLGDTAYTVDALLGYGSNAFVYQVRYQDNLMPEQQHHALIKELFPYHPKGMIARAPDASIQCAPEAAATMQLHRQSFLRGNACHLRIAGIRADQAGVNINSYEANGTVYTVLGDSNGETLLAHMRRQWGRYTLGDAVAWMLALLDALSVFHAEGLLHLDISPDNMLLLPLDRDDERYRRILLIDYNSAWHMEELAAGGGVYFSVKDGYSAPELRQQEVRFISFTTDLFSVCALFYALLYGRPPEYAKLYGTGRVLHARQGLLADALPTVVDQSLAILRRGLQLAPRQRYRDVAALRAAFVELQNRIHGIGITPAALWESSRAQFATQVEQNPQYRYLHAPDGLLPCTACVPEDVVASGGTAAPDGAAMPLVDAVDAAMLRPGGPVAVTAPGGMGKTTALLSVWQRSIRRYDPQAPIAVYIPLYGYRQGTIPYLRGRLLERFRFDASTQTVADALRVLDDMLARTGGPPFWLLLDGLNEAAGDTAPLLREIHELAAMPGVRVLLTARAPVAHAARQIRLLPVDMPSAQAYLNARGVPYPQGAALRTLLETPMLLSLYAATATVQGAAMEIATADELLAAYTQGLLVTLRAQFPGDDALAWRAQYAMDFLLPAIAAQMRRRRTTVLTTAQVYRIVRRCYAQLSHRAFLSAFPRYVGHSRHIRGDAKDGEEWFDTAVRGLLRDTFALLHADEHAMYRLAHTTYIDFFAGRSVDVRRRLLPARVRYALPGVLALCLLASAATYGMVRWIGAGRREIPEVSYPATAQEKSIVENAMTSLTSSLTRLGHQLKLDDEALGSYNGRATAFTRTYARTSAQSAALGTVTAYTADDVAGMLPPGVPLSHTAFLALLNSPGDYRVPSERMMEALPAVLADDSRYTQAQKEDAVALCRQYIDAYAGATYAQTRLLILPLNADGRTPLFKTLPYIPVFSDRFVDPAFEGDEAYLEGVVKAEKLRMDEITGKLRAYGIRLLDGAQDTQ